MATEYRLAETPAEYKACRALAAITGQSSGGSPLTYPTFMAIREDTLVGVLGTTSSAKAPKGLKGSVIAGPLAISKTIHNTGPIAFRLIDEYAALMQKAGVKGVLFAVDQTNESWVTTLLRLGHEPFYAKDTTLWYLVEPTKWRTAMEATGSQVE